MGNFLVRYASRVVIYDCRAVITLATEVLKRCPNGNKLFNSVTLLRRVARW